MSEKNPLSNETLAPQEHGNAENYGNKSTIENSKEKETKLRSEIINEAREVAAAEAIEKSKIEDTLLKDSTEKSSEFKAPVARELKKITLNRELKTVRMKLPLTDKVLSRVIHQPAISTISEASSKSLARPSGLLGGGILAFAGSLGYLYFTRYVGVTYNYLIFIMLFILGFVVGLVIELAIKSTRSNRKTF